MRCKRPGLVLGLGPQHRGRRQRNAFLGGRPCVIGRGMTLAGGDGLGGWTELNSEAKLLEAAGEAPGGSVAVELVEVVAA